MTKKIKILGSLVLAGAIAGGVAVSKIDNTPQELRLKVPKTEILYSEQRTHYKSEITGHQIKKVKGVDKNVPIYSDVPQYDYIEYAYKGDKFDQKVDDKEILEKRTNWIVTRDEGKTAEGLKKFSVQTGYNFVKEPDGWYKVKFATTTPEVFNKTSLLDRLVNKVFALDTGAKAPTANTSDVYFIVEWTNPANVYANEGTYATRELLDADTYGNAYYGFGFGITAGATINGIEMAVEGHYTTTGTRAAKINLYTGYIRVGTNIKGQITNVGTDLPVTNDAVLTFGGATSLPATPPTAAELNDNTTAGFRILLGVERGTGTGNPTGFVDYLTVKVYYTEAPVSTVKPVFILFE